MRIIALLAAGFMLWGCSPKVSGTSAGGLIDLRLAQDNDTIIAVADAHCAKFGKVARVTKGRSRDDLNGVFECVSRG